MNDKPLVMTIEELATALQTSVRTIKYRLAAGAFPIPEVRGIDKKHRWARRDVEAFVANGGVMPGNGRMKRGRAA